MTVRKSILLCGLLFIVTETVAINRLPLESHFCLSHQRHVSCSNCLSIASSVDTIIKKFYPKDKGQFFVLIQGQLGEAMREPCSCSSRERLIADLKSELVAVRGSTPAAIVQELRDNDELNYDPDAQANS